MAITLPLGGRVNHVGSGFDRFHHGYFLAKAYDHAHFRQFNKDHAAQLGLGEVGDANGNSAIGFDGSTRVNRRILNRRESCSCLSPRCLAPKAGAKRFHY